MFFLRETSDPARDLERGFSANVNAWFGTEDEAAVWQTRNGALLPPRRDPVTGKWSGDPERGLSSFMFGDEASWKAATRSLAPYLSSDDPVAVFKSDDYDAGAGLDGEDVFRNGVFVGWISIDASWEDACELTAARVPGMAP